MQEKIYGKLEWSIKFHHHSIEWDPETTALQPSSGIATASLGPQPHTDNEMERKDGQGGCLHCHKLSELHESNWIKDYWDSSWICCILLIRWAAIFQDMFFSWLLVPRCWAATFSESDALLLECAVVHSSGRGKWYAGNRRNQICQIISPIVTLIKLCIALCKNHQWNWMNTLAQIAVSSLGLGASCRDPDKSSIEAM